MRHEYFLGLIGSPYVLTQARKDLISEYSMYSEYMGLVGYLAGTKFYAGGISIEIIGKTRCGKNLHRERTLLHV